MAWDQLTAIYIEATSYVEQEKTEPPTACPYDGEPLDAARNGVLHCQLGNYEWPRDGRII